MQIKHDHLLDLQNAIIQKLSIIKAPQLKDEKDVKLHPDVERWIEK